MRYNVPSETSETNKYNYWNEDYVSSCERYVSLDGLYIWVSSINDNIRTRVYKATGANPDTWTGADGGTDMYLSGWSGGNYVWLGGNVFGGGTNQTGNYWNYRITFFTDGVNGGNLATNYNTSAQSILRIYGYGKNGWTLPNNLVAIDHLYSWDSAQTAIFPARVQSTGFKVTNGTSSQFLKADGSVDSNTYLTSSSLSSYAPLASPALTGTPTAPTASAGTNTTQIATTAFVNTAVNNAVGSVYRVKGTKADYASLPSSGNVAGDVWNVTAAYGNYPAGTNWVWTGSEWDALGGEIDLSSKQDVLTWDTVPTENSTNPVTSGGIYQVIVDNEEVTAAALCDLDARIVDLEANPGQVVVIDVGSVSGSVPSGTFQQCYDACDSGKAVILRAEGYDYISNGYSSNTIYFSEIDVTGNTTIHATSLDINSDDTITQYNATINDNVIESISVNGNEITPFNKNVDLTIPQEITCSELIGSMYRNNVGGSGSLSISGTSGSFPTVSAGTYRVKTECSSATASYTLTITFGEQTYTLSTSNGNVSDIRNLTFSSPATWSGSITNVSTGTVLSIKVYSAGTVVTTVGLTAVSNDYNDLDNKPTIVSDVKLNGTSLTKDANNAVNVQAVTGITVNGTSQTLNNGVAAITIPAGVWSEGTGTNAAILTGSNSTAAGANSVAEGQYTQTTNPAEHAEGMYNASHTGSTAAAKTISSIGIGDSTTRSNALEVMQNGYVYLNGIGEYDGTNPTTSESLQQYLNNNEYVVATAFNDLNDRLIAVESGKQETLISGTNLKTVNGVSLLGSGNLYIEGGGGSGGVGSVFVGSTEYLPVDGAVTLPAYPTTLPASDVSAWAKAASKPTYTASEVGAQATLVSGTNIKTINNESLLGSGNITISGGSASVDSLTTSEIDTIWNNAT